MSLRMSYVGGVLKWEKGLHTGNFADLRATQAGVGWPSMSGWQGRAEKVVRERMGGRGGQRDGWVVWNYFYCAGNAVN